MPTKTTSFGQQELTLDARPDRLDLRDLIYQAPLGNLPPVYPSPNHIRTLLPAYVGTGLILDQKAEGACTGFGLAAVVNYLRWLEASRLSGTFSPIDRVSPRMLYHLARFYDEWEGEDYDGSSCRGALKGWHRHGVCREQLWPYKGGQFVRPEAGWDQDALTRPLGVYYRVNKASVVDMQAAIHAVGAIYVSANVHEGWSIGKSGEKDCGHDNLPVIGFEDKPVGGHAFALVGYNQRGFVVQNSWGERWGWKGFAILTYEDWVVHGSDVWAVTMGVPLERGPACVSGKRQGPSVSPAARALSGYTGTSEPPLADEGGWTRELAYRHTLVTGNDGRILNRIPHLRDAADAARFVALEQPLDWFRQQGVGKPWKLAIYAHGGLNAEDDSLERIRVLGPNFIRNGIYPLFTTWKSGWSEVLANMLEDRWRDTFGAAGIPKTGLGDAFIEASDRTLEVACRYLAVRGMWSEMKENVARSTEPGRGLSELSRRIRELADAATGAGSPLEVHLIGHSAGAFVGGRLLLELGRKRLVSGSCTLFAPACDLEFTLAHYGKAISNQWLQPGQLAIHGLSDQLELDDSVGPYRKSLLYLISRALERLHKTPILGLQTASLGPDARRWNADRAMQRSLGAWRDFQRQHGIEPRIWDQPRINTGRNSLTSSHGCFDNSQYHLQDALERILGGKLKRSLTPLDY